jgi:hypothetical protein
MAVHTLHTAKFYYRKGYKKSDFKDGFVKMKSIGRNQRLGYIDARFSMELSHA